MNLKKLKAFFFSEKGNYIINALLFLGLFLRNSCFMAMVCVLWLLYLSQAIKRKSSKEVRVVNYIMCIAAILLLLWSVFTAVTRGNQLLPDGMFAELDDLFSRKVSIKELVF